jgi:hypothetical protein
MRLPLPRDIMLERLEQESDQQLRGSSDDGDQNFHCSAVNTTSSSNAAMRRSFKTLRMIKSSRN